MTDKRVETVPLPEDGDKIAQEVTGAETVVGSGEWPSPSTPPTGPSPGTGDDAAPSRGSGAEKSEEPLLKDMLAADPTAGGSRSAPSPEDDPAA